jgi:hypothetical protein
MTDVPAPPTPPEPSQAFLPVLATRAQQAVTVLQQIGAGKSRNFGPSSMIYATASGILLAVAIRFILSGSILTGILVLLPAVALAGFSWLYME